MSYQSEKMSSGRREEETGRKYLEMKKPTIVYSIP